jgi:hypothetical protein
MVGSLEESLEEDVALEILGWFPGHVRIPLPLHQIQLHASIILNVK